MTGGRFAPLRMLARDERFVAQGLRFALVGLSNGVVGLGLTYACYNLLNIHYAASNAIGYCCGLANSYVWNRKWTFKSRKSPGREIVFFLLFFGVSYGLNLAAVTFAVRVCDLHPNVAQLWGIVVYTSTNFLLNRYVTFH